MPLTQIDSQRLYRRIAGQIAGMIDRGEFAAGARLPPERELAREPGVSRTSVREAIISLEIAGLVEVRVGNGIFVRANGRIANIAASTRPLTTDPYSATARVVAVLEVPGGTAERLGIHAGDRVELPARILREAR